MDKLVYSFNEGAKEMNDILGGKGANLAEMTRLGLPVPFGFTVSTDACNRYYDEKNNLTQDITEAIFEKIGELENVTEKTFGSTENPLLVSVRSGSVFSMPAVMDTIVNLGINDYIVQGLENLTGDSRFAYDTYARFVRSYGRFVCGAKADIFYEAECLVCASDVPLAYKEMSAEQLKALVKTYKNKIFETTGKAVPSDCKVQLIEGIKAVFDSWHNENNVFYRQINEIPHRIGTAANVQAMVFGNLGKNSCTGTVFTRNPLCGENTLYGEIEIDAQGEDIIRGVGSPFFIADMKKHFPSEYDNLLRIVDILEKHFRDMQDIEFTVENGKLYILQTKNGKRTAQAAIKIAADMVAEEMIDKKTAVARIEPEQIEALLRNSFDREDEAAAYIVATGRQTSPGAASGELVFSSEEAVSRTKKGRSVILVRNEIIPEDLAGIVASDGILAIKGGMTSHASAFARGLGKCCLTDIKGAYADEEKKLLTVGNKTFKEGDGLSLNGSKGIIYEGILRRAKPVISGDFAKIMEWADEFRSLGVRANADNPEDALQALEFGAEGIGLCRTEHMFFNEDRIPAIRKMVLADTAEKRRQALERIKPYQQGDFMEMFKVMGDRPVTIRLLDPPLHEFLPCGEEEIIKLSDETDIPLNELREKIRRLNEFNPMLGTRGCRLAVFYPEIARMQTEAIIMAAIRVKKDEKIDVLPEIMIPLIINKTEVDNIKAVIDETAKRCFTAAGMEIEYQVGTMIETPRAALTADEIATSAEFFSFGTNDMTQMVMGLSREDTGSLIREYRRRGIFDDDPFKTIDASGVGKLVEMGLEGGRKSRPRLKAGVCGEHGGDPRSIDFFNKIGMNYVSCAPYRVPAARLAAAQAAIRDGGK